MDRSQAFTMRTGNASREELAHSGGQQAHQATGGAGSPKAHSLTHTLTACCRCRSRKTKCDPGLPRCGPCERSNSTCEYLDKTKGKTISRLYVIHLQKKIQALEEELDQLSQEQYKFPDAEVLVRSGGYVRVKENDESRYLGPSSGIAITRLVMELAKQNTNTKSIKEIVPEVKAQQIKNRFKREEEKPTSKVYPLISDVAAPELPSRGLTNYLVEKFNLKAQYTYPTLHEPSFQDVIEDVYNGSADPYKNFTLRMVIAISMQKLDTLYAGLADSLYLAALPFLEKAIKPMNLGTLQCFALIAQYSLLTPTRTAAYWVVGLAAKLCQEMGITEECSIAPVDNYKPRYDALEIDMRRRLFFIIMSMEFGLAHSLGRPSAFGTTFDHTNVRFFATVEDRFITKSGVTPGSPQCIKKRIAIHFFKMRILQAEIRRKLYLKRRPEPTTDHDPWFVEMQDKLTHWKSSSPRNDEGSGISETWFIGRYNTMIVFLYRPSPQVPTPSVDAARRCFDACIFLIHMQKHQIDTGSNDLTWIFTQTLFMALNTVLWALSYPDIRREHPRKELQENLDVAQESIRLASQRWPGVESALELYQNLVSVCLKAYDGSSEASYVVESASNKTSPASLQDALTPPQLSSPGTLLGASPHSDHNAPRFSPAGYSQEYDTLQRKPHPSPTFSDYSLADSTVSSSYQSIANQQGPVDLAPTYRTTAAFTPIMTYSSMPQSLPSFQPSIYETTLQQYGQYSSIGDQYSQYLHAPYIPQQPLHTLNQEGQTELMKSLENNWMGWG